MNLTIPRDILSSLAEIAASVVEARPAQPIRANVLIVVGTGRIAVRGTDDVRSIAAFANVPATSKPGCIAVPKGDLLGAVKVMPAGDVSVTSDGKKFTLKSGKRTINVPCIDGGDFPAARAMPKNPDVLTIPAKALADILGRVAYARNEDSTTPYMHGALLDFDGKAMRAVATNRHKLVAVAVPYESKVGAIIVPYYAVDSLIALCGKGEEVRLTIGVDCFSAAAGNVELVSAVCADAASFPPWRLVIPADRDARAVCSRTALADAVRAVITTAQSFEGARRIALDIGPRRIALSSANSDASSADEVECGFEGKPTTLLFNGAYVAETLAAMRTDDVAIEYAIGPQFSPVIFRGVGDESATALVMPQVNTKGAGQ